MNRNRNSKKNKNKGDLFTPLFLPQNQSTNRPPKVKAKAAFKWKVVDSVIRDSKDRVYFSKKKVMAPEGWSQTAIDIAASKYLRASISKENSILALVERIGAGVFEASKRSELFQSTYHCETFVEEIKFLLYSQRAAFNSPVWFNLGLKQAYGVSSKSEHFAWDYKRKKVTRVNDAYARPQCSACFIQSIDDSIDSIFTLIKNEAKIFKYGSGSGTNFSNLRSKHEELSSGGRSSGLISFLEVFDKAAGAIKSGGTTRRAAKMVCLDLDHPEIEEFIEWKVREEEKAKALIKSGFSADLEGEAYKSVSGQNANNSVRVPDRFMQLLAKQQKRAPSLDQKWPLLNRAQSQAKKKRIFKQVPVSELWKRICVAAWTCADPGLQFHDTINRFHTCPNSDEIRASNPCSEYMFLDDSACNLASINLVSFYDEKSMSFQLDEFMHTARVLLLAQEALVDFSSYPTARIAQNSHDFRPLGLGFSNLGALLMRQALPYDSDEGRAWAGFLAAVLCGVAYLTSAEMAQKLGPFPGFKKNRQAMIKVINLHRKAAQKLNWHLLPQNFKEEAIQLWDRVLEMGSRYGFRNAQVTAIAPTGTIGLVMDCDTTGIEPDFSLVKFKNLSGGGSLTIVNQAVACALTKLNYDNTHIKKIEGALLRSGSIRESGIRPEHHQVFACATGEIALSPEAHLKMMAAVQPFISGAISKTVNLPNEATIEDIGDTFFKAWQLGIKSVAIYRDRSKFAQPLNQMSTEFPKCSECGYRTILESGCYRCPNCGTTTACAS